MLNSLPETEIAEQKRIQMIHVQMKLETRNTQIIYLLFAEADLPVS